MKKKVCTVFQLKAAAAVVMNKQTPLCTELKKMCTNVH